MSESGGLYIVLLSLHGLIRGENLELGRDADTGGQTKYVVELARALAAEPRVERVELITRLVVDPRVSPDYAVPREPIAERASIVRIPFGPRKYLRKEALWPHLASFVDGALLHFRKVGRTPDVLHGHYADAGLAGGALASLLQAPFVFTGHSLGREKLRRLMDDGLDERRIDERYNIRRRIEAEEQALENAALVIASTEQEASLQYAAYDAYRKTRTAVLPPGVDLSRFRPPRRFEPEAPIAREIARFLREPDKPWVLALSRADERKNIGALVDAYALTPALRERANLVLVAGSRDDISAMGDGPRGVLTDLLLRIDRHDLYGSVAYPKSHLPDEVPDIYRAAARTRGVFVNPALTEPFGLTLLEAAASGLPVVATDDGGPRDILERAANGLLIDPLDSEGIGLAILDALSDSARWRRWAASGLRAVEREYTWSGHVRRYLREVEKILGRPRRGRAVAKTRLPSAQRLIVTDVDNSLLGDPAAVAAFAERLRAAGDSVVFGVATGRRLPSAMAALAKAAAPAPQFWIASAGTEIFYGERTAPDRDWTSNIDWRWNAEAVRKILDRLPGLKLQPRAEQGPFKVSYFIDPAKAPPLSEIEALLRRGEYRGRALFSLGQFLDIVPVRASKGLAIRYLAHRWGIPMDRVLVAGDCGSDEDMLAGLSRAVVVANHSPEIDKLRGLPRIYFARSLHAWGILEGIDHYAFLDEPRVEHVAQENAR